MKKANQEKKKLNTSTSKGVKLPLIQSNIHKDNMKDPQENSAKANKKLPSTKNNNQMPNIPLTKAIPNDKKLFGTNNKGQNSSKIEDKNKKINNAQNGTNLNTEPNQDGGSRISEDKLTLIKKQRKQRLKQEKKEEEKQIKIYEKLLEEYKKGTKDKKEKNDGKENIEENPKMIVSSKKAQTILEEGGMLDVYKHVLAQLCKNGLPNGNIFEYASYVVKNYEKKWKEKKSQMMKEKIEKHYEEKQNEINNCSGGKKIVNKSLEHRDELKFIQSLDKSRSGRNIVPLNKNNNSQNGKTSKFGKNNNSSNKDGKKEDEGNSINKEKEENAASSNRLKENSAEKNNKLNNNNSNSTRNSNIKANSKSKEKQSSNNLGNKNNKKGK